MSARPGDRAPLPGRRSWYGFCACRGCGNRSSTRRTKRTEQRQARREIDDALNESEHHAPPH